MSLYFSMRAASVSCRRWDASRSLIAPRACSNVAWKDGSILSTRGLLRCGRCGRKMQVANSGRDGRRVRYACVHGHIFHDTESACQTLGGGRPDKEIAAIFLEAVTPAGVVATTGAIA